jgi:heme exporter protein A
LQSILDITGLEVERDGRRLVEDLSFTVQTGSVLRIEGPNGAGKTSLLRILAGLYSAFRGEIRFQGKVLDGAQQLLLRQQSLFLGHAPAIKMSLSARENLRWLAALQFQLVSDGELEDALVRVGLSGYEDVNCRYLSAGQQRRVALARLFITPVSLWMLDEPFTALDKQAVLDLEGWISEFAAQGGAVVLTTHHDLTVVSPLQSLTLGRH